MLPLTSRPKLDLVLYLVTDSSLLPPNTTLASHVESAIKGGVTIVQLREKKLETAAFIALAREIHAITKAAEVPLLINDRVDVALAVGCEGVHIGWKDIDYSTARKLLGPHAIIGLSVSNLEQAKAATATSCDYLGIGPVYATATKPNHNYPLAPQGVRKILEYLQSSAVYRYIPVVAIGSVNTTNIQRVKYQSEFISDDGSQRSINGVAVVSAIIAAPDAEVAARNLKSLFDSQPPWIPLNKVLPSKMETSSIPSLLLKPLKAIWQKTPLVHHITNNVVKTFSANVTLAIGASPIMSEDIHELPDLAAITGGLVVNMGTSQKDARGLLLAAVQENNARGNPVVLDPVGAGATRMRRETVKVLLEGSYLDVIKGNEGEIRTVAGEEVQMRGVDTAGERGKLETLIEIVRSLARRERNIIIMTGVTDIISDGSHTVLLQNGHEYQGYCTGIGCSLASVIAAALAASDKTMREKFIACVAAVTAYNIAAERAARTPGVNGPGTWVSVFVDKIWEITRQSLEDITWEDEVKVQLF
ncbi:thiamine biosynthetic bifunctional enzyme [Rhizina undulata]